MGPQEPKDVSRGIARDLSALVEEFAALKGDANHWLAESEYAVLRYRLESARGGGGGAGRGQAQGAAERGP